VIRFHERKKKASNDFTTTPTSSSMFLGDSYVITLKKFQDLRHLNTGNSSYSTFVAAFGYFSQITKRTFPKCSYHIMCSLDELKNQETTFSLI